MYRLPGDHFGAVGLVAVVKSNMALQVVSAGDHVGARSVPVRHVEKLKFEVVGSEVNELYTKDDRWGAADDDTYTCRAH